MLLDSANWWSLASSSVKSEGAVPDSAGGRAVFDDQKKKIYREEVKQSRFPNRFVKQYPASKTEQHSATCGFIVKQYKR